MRNKYSNTFTGENAYTDYYNYINGSKPEFPNIALMQSGSTAGEIIIQDTAPNDYMIFGTTTGTTDFRIGGIQYFSVSNSNSIQCHVITGDTTNYFYAYASDITGTPKSLVLGTEGNKITSFIKLNYTNSGLTTLRLMFSDCQNISYVDFSGINVSAVTDIQALFASFKGDSLNLDGLNFKSVTNSSFVFSDTSCKEISLKNFYVDNATNIEGMFRNNSKLKKLDLSNFRCPKAGTFKNMFDNCPSLVELDIRNLNTRGVPNDNYSWFGVSKDYNLNKLWIGPDFFNTAHIIFNFKDLHGWTDPDSLEMFVTSAASHDGHGKKIYLYNNTMNALTQAQKDTLTARGWTLST